VPAYGSQVHHATRDWTDGGLTNVDDLGLACGPDNRMVGPDGWTTKINDRHDVEWIPPPHLDTGQPRINHYHRPEELHPPPNDAVISAESATNGHNATHRPGDPDPPDDQFPCDADDVMILVGKLENLLLAGEPNGR
jgi:hypothetical protein